jgi:hypothetical protein
MDTLDNEEPATVETEEVTPQSELSEENVNDDTSTDGEQEDAAVLKKRLADKDRYIKELESKKPKREDTRPEEIKDLEWRLENKERIALVKDEYQELLDEGYEGEKVSNKIALELAEKKAKIDTSGAKRGRQDDMSTPSTTTRNETSKKYESEEDRVLNLTAEKKKKLEQRHPHLKGE